MRENDSCALLLSPVRAHVARHHLKVQHMDACEEQEEAAGASAAAAAVLLENEAESMQVQEEKCAAAELNNLNSCPVCCLNFYSREPKLLPCLHSFCKKCLPTPSRNLAMVEAPNSRVDSVKPLNVIRCPVCRQECMEVDVMENVFVEDSVEAPSSTVERSAQICMTCDDNTEAVGFCVICVEYLCSACVEAHQRVKFTKDHTITQKEEVSEEIHGWSTQRPMFCGIHKQEPVKLFCETCDLLTCRDCQLVRHKDHRYHFLEDAYKYHKQHVDSMTHQLQDKRMLIEEVSSAINNRLLQAEENRTSVETEIKNSICSLIAEMNKKGQMLLNQLESVTKDHKRVLQKQQEDIGYLSRHLDHVIGFTKWATARNKGTAFLHCKRLILFQIGNLLQAKCSTSFVPQTVIRFQGRSPYWASSLDLGSLLVESTPGKRLPGFQGIPHDVKNPREGPSGSPYGFAIGNPRNTLALLQMEVEKLNPTTHWQAQPPWGWCQSVRLPRSGPQTVLQRAPSHNVGAQLHCRFMVPPPSNTGPTSGPPNPGFNPQHYRLLGSSSGYQSKPGGTFSSPLYSSPVPIGDVALPQPRHTASDIIHYMKAESPYLNQRTDPVYATTRNPPQTPVSCVPCTDVQGKQNPAGLAAVSQEENSESASWEPAETHQTIGDEGPSVRKRPRPSPGPIVVIKDEPDDDISYDTKRTNLPDSTGDQPDLLTQVSSQDREDVSTRPRVTDKVQMPVHTHSTPQDHSNSNGNDHNSLLKGETQRKAPLKRSDRGVCTVCQTGGELLLCDKCSKHFHLFCHIPALRNVPSGCWSCSFCLDSPEMGSKCKPKARGVKTESESEGGFLPEEKRKCERLLLHLFCSPDFGESPTVCANNRKNGSGPSMLHTVRKRLEATESLRYKNLAEFVSDVRLACRNWATKPEPGATAASKGLNEQFEERLKNVFPEHTFPEMKSPSTPDSVS
ncbi:E3 ubiquitin-protein ligase TRIM33-like isoform X1 [Takifugu rubripes]|uniref:E3 ubiquitin-protein ligase TRIM33-like isoform X1 n=1 Tax=Takifugu rubripes TaxID=31033 RepID=UPI0011460904|nr:E3 ubiquitin-protein ligase TRIM33-like isoform X1 [Takifugu rubripes]